jgi:hypothetical protein
MSTRPDPYISVVVTSRNDDHGGDPLKRLQAFINCFDAQCCRTGLDAEVIIVEWNPPPDKPRLQSLVRWPSPCVCTYRFVDVPPELHGTLQYADVLPLFQMIAKNVGIRRARGRFVLATNIDIIFANELVEYLASGQLEPGYLYRVDRHDIQAAVPIDAPLDVQMAYCAEHHLRVHARWGSYAVDGVGRALPMSEDIVDAKVVSLGAGWHVREGTQAAGFYRWATDRAFVHIDRSVNPVLAGPAVLEIECQTNPYDSSSWLDLEIADEAGTVLAYHRITGRRIWRLPLEGDIEPRTLALRVAAASPEGRRHLPAFERRGAMNYLVRSIRVMAVDEARAQPTWVYPPAQWQAMTGATVDLDQSGVGMVTTDLRPYSYAVQYGPMRAPVTGLYRFALTYDVFEGGISMGVLDDKSREWLPAVADGVLTPRGHVETVAVQLAAGAVFSLMLSNNRGDGEGVSRVAVKELTGSIDPLRVIGVGRADSSAGRTSVEEVQPPTVPERRPSRPESWIDRRRRRKQSLAEDSLTFPLDGWRPANFVDLPDLARHDDGLATVSRGSRWSYCIEYGPFRAPIAGTYRFALEYELLEGGILAGLLSEDKRRWLRSSSREDAIGDRRTLVFSAALRRGQTCWLTLSNNHEPGGVSRFVVTNLGASVEPRDVLAMIVTTLRFSTDQDRYWMGQEITNADDGVGFPLEIWRIGDARDRTRIERTADGLAVNTDPRRWSYALEAGPIRAVARGTHSFTLSYDLAEGGVALGVMNRDKTRWLRPPFADAAASGQRTLTTTVDLKKGQLCWLIVANSHPQGDQPSGFVVRTLACTVEPMSWRSSQMKAIGRWRERVAARIDDGYARLRGRLAGLVRRLSAPTIGAASGRARRLVNRVRVGIVRNSAEYTAMRASLQALELEHRATVAQVAQLSDLSHLHKLLHDHRPDPLHLNGCGDFQLMAREHWFELKGYPEFQTFSMNIDGLLSSVAYYAGIAERPLESPHHIYHLEHEVGSGWSPEGEAVLRRRIAERGITWLDARDVFVWSAYMHSLRRPMIFNTSDWGFGALQLSESIVEPRLDQV